MKLSTANRYVRLNVVQHLQKYLRLFSVLTALRLINTSITMTAINGLKSDARSAITSFLWTIRFVKKNQILLPPLPDGHVCLESSSGSHHLQMR